MSKTYLANTPLILTDADGTDYRVERGATVVLTDEQFAAVAAHVRPVTQPEADVPPETPVQPEPVTQDEDAVPPETPDGEEQPDKQSARQKRGKTKDTDGAE
ncbi:hypothetical protein [Kingella denitrificans]|uniref:hypothetical protein n=1 Tax=Kingella denitrificans TaxID=502 RepID=UPI00288B52B3|nr:hypothetical protein [Kingella denitrificans]